MSNKVVYILLAVIVLEIVGLIWVTKVQNDQLQMAISEIKLLQEDLAEARAEMPTTMSTSATSIEQTTINEFNNYCRAYANVALRAGVEIYEEMNYGAAVIAALEENDQLWVIRAESDSVERLWYNVVLEGPGGPMPTGWVPAHYVTFLGIDESCSQLPVEES